MFKNLKLRTKLILGFIVVSLPILAVGYYSIDKINKISSPIKQEIPAYLKDIYNKTKLSNAAQSIQYYDEVLTQAARNYAFTKDVKWKNIYDEHVGHLDEVIKFAMAFGDSQDDQYFSSVNSANLALVDLEMKSIGLVDQGQAEEAIKVLESGDYWSQKKIYKDALDSYLSRRLQAEEKTIVSSQDSLLVMGANINAQLAAFSENLWILVALSLLFSLLLGLLFSFVLVRRMSKLINFVREMSAGKSVKPIAITRSDELGELGSAFNNLSVKLSESRIGLERQVKERTKELDQKSSELKKTLAESERLNKSMIGRELEMIKLKKEIMALKKNKNV